MYQAGALEAPRAVALATLVKAYPDFLDRVDGNDLVWKDGTRQRIDDGKPAKTFEAMLDEPDIKDMFAMTYPAGDKGLAPAVNFDPGRIRYTPLFVKMYGDCQRSNLAADAATVVWLRSKYRPRRCRRRRAPSAAGQVPGVLETAARELQLPADRGNEPPKRAWVRHRHRHRRGPFPLLAMVKTRRERPHRLQERDPMGDRARIRDAWLHLGRQVVSLRHHAFRVPARASHDRQVEPTPGQAGTSAAVVDQTTTPATVS